MKDYEERNIIFIYSPCNATGLSALLRTAAEVAAKQYPETGGWLGPFVSMEPPPPPTPAGWRVYVCRDAMSKVKALPAIGEELNERKTK